MKNVLRVSPYWKAVIAGLGPVVTLAHAAVGDSVITSSELIDVSLLVLVALGVYHVPNRPGEPAPASEA